MPVVFDGWIGRLRQSLTKTAWRVHCASRGRLGDLPHEGVEAGRRGDDQPVGIL
jgi:hypothetical protein